MNRLALAGMALLVLALGSQSAHAQQGCLDARRIYFGDPEGSRPATVRASDCFDEIPEWQEIRRRKLGSGDADYWILLNAANERFRAAIEAVAKAAEYDLVAEQGAITVPEGKPAPPDATQAVMAEIRRRAEAKDKE